MSALLPACVTHTRCDNPGPMTLTGTNSYVIAPGPGRVGVVIDPGPLDAAHRRALVTAACEVIGPGERVVVVLTHHHDDHEGGADEFVDALRAAGRVVELVGGAGGRQLEDAEMLGVLQVIAVPGHTADSVALLLEGADAAPAVLFTGDTVLGEGSSFVAHPDGDLTAYLTSLDVLAALVAEATDRAEQPVVLAPGHGPIGADAGAVIETYQAHREERLTQVRSALARIDAQGSVTGDALVELVVDIVYADVDAALRPAVDAIVRAQLAHLGRL